MENHPINAFTMVGKVHKKQSLVTGLNTNSQKEWNKLELLLFIENEKQKHVYVPVTFWNDKAKIAESSIKENDLIAIKGQVVTKEWNNYKDGLKKYFINLNAFEYEILETEFTPIDPPPYEDVTDWDANIPF